MGSARFPSLVGLMWDVVKTPLWGTRVQQSVGGKEIRAQYYSRPLYRWQLKYELLRADATAELQALVGFFHARQGKFDSFLFADPSDNTVTAHGFGVGDGATTAFQLQRTLAGPRQADFGGTYPVATVPRTNVCAGSETVGLTTWSPISGGTGTAPSATAGYPDPRGGLAATRLVCAQGAGTTTSDASFFQSTSSAAATVATSYVASIWLRSNTGASQTVWLSLAGLGGGQFIVTPTWQRVSFTVAGLTTLYIGLRGTFTPGGSAVDLLAFGAQVEVGVTPTAYIPTTSGPATAVPAFFPAAADGFEPVTDLNGPPSLFRTNWQGTQPLFPTPRTNLWLFSEQTDNAAWTKANVTISPNSGTPTPDGTTTADDLNESAVNALHFVAQSFSGLTTNGKYTASVFARASNRTWFRFNITDKAGTSRNAFFDTGNGVAGTVDAGLTVAIGPLLPNGWRRYSVTFSAGSGGTTPSINLILALADGGGSYLGSVSSAMALWGAQLEADTLTPYIPTVGSSVTVTDYALSAAGLVTLAVAPAAGVGGAAPTSLTWTGSYYWRVRFDQDATDFTNFLYQLWEAKSITLQSVK